MFDYILFDLDGTLTDPFEGITNSIVHLLKKFGIEVANRRVLTPFIGPPLVNSFMEYYGFSEEKALKAVEYYREYFSVKGLYENVVCDGIIPLLQELKARGKILVLATSKPEVYAVKILERFSLFPYFNFVAGATLISERVQKSAVIEYALSLAKIEDKSSAVMVGDREHDIFGARVNGLRSIGVTYGYGGLQELKSASADYIVNSPKEILDIV